MMSKQLVMACAEALRPPASKASSNNRVPVSRRPAPARLHEKFCGATERRVWGIHWFVGCAFIQAFVCLFFLPPHTRCDTSLHPQTSHSGMNRGANYVHSSRAAILTGVKDSVAIPSKSADKRGPGENQIFPNHSQSCEFHRLFRLLRILGIGKPQSPQAAHRTLVTILAHWLLTVG